MAEFGVSRGIRNKNPLNIRKDGRKWEGEITPSTDPAFKQFISMAYGYRAAFVNLATYRERTWNTIEKIVQHWAPPSENNTKAYIKHVEEWSGVDRKKVLNKYGSKEDYIAIVAAMSRVENGVPADVKEVRKGYSLQTRLI